MGPDPLRCPLPRPLRERALTVVPGRTASLASHPPYLLARFPCTAGSAAAMTQPLAAKLEGGEEGEGEDEDGQGGWMEEGRKKGKGARSGIGEKKEERGWGEERRMWEGAAQAPAPAFSRCPRRPVGEEQRGRVACWPLSFPLPHFERRPGMRLRTLNL
ncbi:hypothetical protein P7K49_003488 [Saguinus oedipus]|uniref:Uncharacterized protein n=1 Tax=Saguinus oedipus TaxID=9490 RepID=A0ABQ9W880_SAGOE|nr:hypothetical protein P7K49_003488 [Saguinus oedipus]